MDGRVADFSGIPWVLRSMVSSRKLFKLRLFGAAGEFSIRKMEGFRFESSRDGGGVGIDKRSRFPGGVASAEIGNSIASFSAQWFSISLKSFSEFSRMFSDSAKRGTKDEG
jgi:hypothetical protein